jgi:prepilin signal peptidase PulO-like enzyme (type II secretory pathway)
MITAIALFVLGLCAGSFIDALVWRMHEQSKAPKTKGKNLSILSGRSQCPKCGHSLSAKDLVPLLSWIALKGKCRYCKKPISVQIPIIEISTGLTFMFSYLLWPVELASDGQMILFTAWLLVSVGLLALLVYDFKWMLLPNRILYPTLLVAAAGRLIYILGFSPDRGHDLTQWVLAVAVASGIFWLLFMVSSGKWIGFGDVRLGLITGTALATPALAFFMIFLASALGTLFIAPALLAGKKSMTSRIPFGPFLIAATFLALLFGQGFIDWYQELII